MRGRDKDTVNRCLYDYFAAIVDILDCDGIWWDTISLPLKPDARREAINKMHINYASAEFTVVHDEYLLQCEWREDGMPCLALVLSPWFTRGWTALELAKAGSVRVLFKGSDPDKPLIKNLNTEVLASDPARCTRAHWIASSLIRRLRKPISDVSDILTILQPRNTSWERDYKLIAALLAEFTDGGGNKTEADHTRAILTHVGKVGMASLFHGYETIAFTGGFSWCPHALRDMPSQAAGDLNEGTLTNTTLTIDARGAVTGSFYYRFVTSADTREGVLVQYNASRAKPRSQYAKEQNISNPPDENRTNNALRSYQNCILLRDHWRSTGPALLVATAGKEPNPAGTGDIIDCRYIASVFDNTPQPTGRYDKRYYVATFRLGNDRGRYDVRANELLGQSVDHGSGSYDFGSGGSQPPNEEAAYGGGHGDDDEAQVPSDGEEGWIPSEDDGPRRPRSMFGKGKQKQAEKEKAERKKAREETAEREKAEREKVEKEKVEKEKAEREKAEREKAEREKAEREKAERARAQAYIPPPQYVPPAPATPIIRRFSCCFQEYSLHTRCGCGKNGLPIPHLGEAYFGKSRCYDPNCAEHRGGRNRTYLP